MQQTPVCAARVRHPRCDRFSPSLARHCYTTFTGTALSYTALREHSWRHLRTRSPFVPLTHGMYATRAELTVEPGRLGHYPHNKCLLRSVRVCGFALMSLNHLRTTAALHRLLPRVHLSHGRCISRATAPHRTHWFATRRPFLHRGFRRATHCGSGAPTIPFLLRQTTGRDKGLHAVRSLTPAPATRSPAFIAAWCVYICATAGAWLTPLFCTYVRRTGTPTLAPGCLRRFRATITLRRRYWILHKADGHVFTNRHYNAHHPCL